MRQLFRNLLWIWRSRFPPRRGCLGDWWAFISIFDHISTAYAQKLLLPSFHIETISTTRSRLLKLLACISSQNEVQSLLLQAEVLDFRYVTPFRNQSTSKATTVKYQAQILQFLTPYKNLDIGRRNVWIFQIQPSTQSLIYFCRGTAVLAGPWLLWWLKRKKQTQHMHYTSLTDKPRLLVQCLLHVRLKVAFQMQ